MFGGFEYYTGEVDGKSQWGYYRDGAYERAFAVKGVPYWLFRVTSVTKHADTYYMALTVAGQWVYEARGESPWHPRRGMLVLTSEDGFRWSDGTFVAYTDVEETCDGSTTFCDWMPQVYAHYWVPESIISWPGRIAYTFSVRRTYWGFFYDYWFPAGPPYIPGSEGTYRLEPSEDEHPGFPVGGFRDYNTKMYWYKIP